MHQGPQKTWTTWIAGLIASVLVLSGCGLSGAGSPSISLNRAMQGTLQAKSVKARADHVIVKLRSGASDQQVKSLSRFVAGTIPSLGVSVLNVGVQGAGSQLASLAAAGVVEFSEPDYIAHTQVTTNDPALPRQYGHKSSSIPAAWDVTMGDPNVVVAVVDTGVDLTHPDLRDRLVPGISFVPNTSGPKDDNGHGTHVAGIIAASANNGVGVAGVAPRCRIMPVKVLDANGEGNTSDIVAGIVWAADHGARVINLSLGGAGGGKALEAAVAYAQRRGSVVVAAMGNDGENQQDYPASFPGVIAVGAVDAGDQVAAFSNYGRWISVVAPGDQIYSTLPTYHFHLLDEDPDTDLGYGYLSGTSMATPYVAGVAALVCSVNPRLTPAGVKSVIERSADDLGAPGYDPQTGWGRINAARAVGAVH